MTTLYSKWAWVYHEMYLGIFDYEGYFRRFERALKKYGCGSVLEVGCGSGNLAEYFLAAGYQYTGLDVAEEMLSIAREKTPGARFIEGDMRRFSLRRKVDAVVIGGRSFSYMTTNQDVLDAMRSIHQALKPGGIFVFDNFEAGRMFTQFRKRVKQDVRNANRRFVRLSKLSLNLEAGWTFNWDASYLIQEKDGKKMEFRDVSVLRAFTPDEMRLFLAMAGFEAVAIRKQGADIFTVARVIS
jgi:SAM-dependent methyltransferase